MLDLFASVASATGKPLGRRTALARDVTYQPRRPRALLRLRLGKPAWLFGGLIALNAAVFIYHGDPRSRVPSPPDKLPKAGAMAPRAMTGADAGAATFDPSAGIRTPGPVQKVATVGLRQGQTVAQALGGVGVGGPEATAAIASLRQLVDFRRLRPGHTLRARLGGDGGLLSLDVRRGPADQVRAEKQDGGWRAAKVDIPVASVTTVVRGTVQSSLWDAMEAVGEDPRFAIDVAEIFAWDIDFYSDLREGDTFSVVVEKRYADGKFVEYGPISAARFVNEGGTHEAFSHPSPGSDGAALSYYDADGQSLRKQLLKSPLKYGHVTSGFGMRVHPILGYGRAHNGIDYGCPIGTPVQSVGDGRVLRAGWVDGYGNFVEVRHANGWVSEFGHLSRILVRSGQRISQKDVIALTGSTGLSTGPHLHYGLRLNGGFVDPSRQKFERGQPLSGDEKRRFSDGIARLRGELDDGRIAHGGVASEAEEG
jgi:murein DD-endopeptidase MepM/ murein hydrolase activator NlpD